MPRPGTYGVSLSFSLVIGFTLHPLLDPLFRTIIAITVVNVLINAIVVIVGAAIMPLLSVIIVAF